MNGNGGRVSRFVCKSFQNGALVQETLNKRSKNRPLFSLICCIHDSSFKRTKTDHLLTLMSFLTFARMFLWCFTQERKSNGFQKAWGQVNNDRIFFSFFQVDISLNWHCKYNKKSFIKVYVKVMFIFKSLAWSLSWNWIEVHWSFKGVKKTPWHFVPRGSQSDKTWACDDHYLCNNVLHVLTIFVLWQRVHTDIYVLCFVLSGVFLCNCLHLSWEHFPLIT